MKLETRRVGAVLVVEVKYDHLDADNSEEFKSAILPLLTQADRIVFDLSEVGFLDSSGLGIFLSCIRRVKALGGDLKLCGLQSMLRSLFELVKMNRLIDVYTTCEEAIAALAPAPS